MACPTPIAKLKENIVLLRDTPRGSGMVPWSVRAPQDQYQCQTSSTAILAIRACFEFILTHTVHRSHLLSHKHRPHDDVTQFTKEQSRAFIAENNQVLCFIVFSCQRPLRRAFQISGCHDLPGKVYLTCCDKNHASAVELL